MPASFDNSDQPPGYYELEAYLLKTASDLRSTAILRMFKQIESTLFPKSLLRSITVAKSLAMEELSQAGSDLTSLALSVYDSGLSCMRWIELIFWDAVCDSIQICYHVSGSSTKLVVMVDGHSSYLRELYCAKEYSASSGEESACRVFLNNDRLKKFSPDQLEKIAQVDKKLRRISQPFPRLDYGLTSILYFEVHVYICGGKRGQREHLQKIRKLKNVKELASLWAMEEEGRDVDARSLSIGDLRLLGNFLLHKMQHYETFNMMIEKDELSEEPVPAIPDLLPPEFGSAIDN